MDKLKSLLLKLAATDAALDKLLASDELTAEQQIEHDKLTARRSKEFAAVKREQARLAREEEAKQLAAETAAAQLRQERAVAVASTAGGTRVSAPDLPVVGHTRAELDALTIPAQCRRHRPRNFKGTRRGMDAEQRAYRFGMWALSRVAADMPNRFRFPAAVDYVNRHMTVANTESDANGGMFLVPEEFGTDLIDLREVYGVARRIFRMVPMTSDTRVDPRRLAGLAAYFTQEGAAGTESEKQWNQVRLTAKDLMVISRFTNQLAMDAVINIGDDLAGEIAYAFANKEDDCAFNGTGTSTYGGIVGVRTKLNNCDGAGTQSAGLYLTSHSTWATLTLADFQATAGLLPQYADTDRVCWLCHRAFYYSTMQVVELAAGGVTALEVQEGDRRPRPMFLGYPVEFSQIFPSATAAATVPVCLGDFELGCSFGDRMMDSIAFSEHATIGGENVFERNQIAIRGIERMDINVHDAGSASIVGPIVGLYVHA